MFVGHVVAEMVRLVCVCVCVCVRVRVCVCALMLMVVLCVERRIVLARQPRARCVRAVCMPPLATPCDPSPMADRRKQPSQRTL